jgi:glutamyl-tRNA synthetase
VRQLTDDLGFAVQPKKYKKNPELYPGSIVDVTNLMRVAVTGRQNAPDLWEISHVLGEEETRRRLTEYRDAE